MRKSAASVDLGFIKPQLPTLSAEPPEGEDWIHEIKFDGWRMQFIIDGDRRVRAFTKTGLNWTAEVWPLVEAVGKLPATSAILDGEMILPDAKGHPDFKRLRATIRLNPERLCFVAFDLLHLDGDYIFDKPKRLR